MSRRPIAALVAVILLAAVVAPATAVGPTGSAPGLRTSQSSDRIPLRNLDLGIRAPVVPPKGTVGVVSSIGYIDDGSGTIAVVGEVLNNMTTRRVNIEVRATLYNASDVVIGTISDIVFTEQLAYGSLSPFVLFDDAPADVAGYTVAVLDTGAPITVPVVSVMQLTVGAPVIVGDTRTYNGNLGNASPYAVTGFVAVTTYDAGGEVLDTNWTDPIALSPMTGTAYSIDLFDDPSLPVARAVVTAQAWDNANDNHYLTSLDNFFEDIGVSSFRGDILWLYENGITKGCSQGKYCPTSNVRRDEMASFLVRALGLTGTPPDAFSDDNGNTHEVDINRIKAAGITSGCATGLFCPAASVRRDEMASFLSRALELTEVAPDAFTDDNGNTHEANINKVAAAGVTTGCGASIYCPAGLVSRAQMAAFLHRAFD